MKTIYKHFYLALCSVLAFAMGACTEEVDYEPAEVPEGAQVYFPSTLPSQVNLDATASSFNVQIGRAATDAATVNLNATDESGLFTIPTSISFAAGEKTANLTIGYDATKFEYDDYKSITLSIADENAKTPYGTSSYTFKVGIPSPWTSMGMCTYMDEFLFDNAYQVELQRNDLDKNLYRLVRPYREGLDKEGYGGVTGEEQEFPEFRLLQPGDVWKDVTITMNDLVAFNDISTEWTNTNYGETVWLLHPSRFTSMGAESYWENSRVVSYQENGLPAVIELAPYYYMFGVGGWDYTKSPSVTIVFPGVVLLDTSAEVEYTGLFTSLAEEVSAVVNITLGEDVESAKVALVPSAEEDATIEAIYAGMYEGMEIEASGEYKLPMPIDATEGKYSIIVVTYIGKEAQEAGITTFKYTPATAETWTKIGVGDYSYAGIIYEGVDSDLTLFQSDVNSKRYKIEHWGGDVDFIFTYDAETGKVVVEDQETGTVHSEYGMINVADYTFFGEGAFSYYEDGVFNFAVTYYVSAGTFGSSYETFTLKSAAESESVNARSFNLDVKSVNKNIKIQNKWIHMNPVFIPISK